MYGGLDGQHTPKAKKNTQSQTQYLTLAASGVLAAADAQTDIGAYYNLLCITSGVCCLTNLCNNASVLNNSTVLLILSFIYIGFLKKI